MSRYTTKNIAIISQKSNGRCFYCNSSKPDSIDHFFPNRLHEEWGLAEYTDNNDLENLFLSCKSCNSRKKAKHPEDFLGKYDAWHRYFRANYRAGLVDFREYTL